MRPRTLAAALMSAPFLAGTLSAAPLKADPFLVVIDPGHGGADHGAVVRDQGRRVSEKDVTLKLALAAAREMRARGMRVVLTREEDRDVGLTERTALANRLGARVFLSLHMNSASGRRAGEAQGVETYILNASTDQSSRRLADLENAVLSGSVANKDQDTPDVGLIVKDLLIDGNLPDSRRLACAVQGSLVNATSAQAGRRARNRGVRQALFYVLLGADMPSALVETGFLDHPRDRSLVLSESGRRSIARALADAMAGFRDGASRRVASSKLSTCLIR
ncbi:MAG: N-acetylmuramoyl-L-alanine amidase [Bdellovibrionales bacterium]|nr:N-acetylmuramoyl-L-alanine amidase [Bdellovibrionales bacterium]